PVVAPELASPPVETPVTIDIDGKQLHLYKDFKQFEAEKRSLRSSPSLASFPAIVKIYYYDMPSRLFHYRHCFSSWSAASNSKIMYIYQLKNIGGYLNEVTDGERVRGNSLFYIARKFTSEERFVGFPLIQLRISSPDKYIDKKQIKEINKRVS